MISAGVQRILAVYQRRTIGHVTMAPTLFEAVANALDWWEVVCRQFGTARRLPDEAVLWTSSPPVAAAIAFASAPSGNGSRSAPPILI